MTSKPRVFSNPFAVPSSSNTNTSNQNNASKHLSFSNYNPALTLQQQIKPIMIQQSPYTTRYTDNRKRTYHAMNDYNNNNNNNYNNKRRKRQKYPNDGGLTDEQYLSVLNGRKKETASTIKAYINERKANYPTKINIQNKRKLINIKQKRGQILSINEKIMKYQDDTGNKKTPSVLRFLKTPKFDHNIVKKVLKKEIQQEYSAVLQCFRYFIKSNYFNQPTMDDINNNNNNDQNDDIDDQFNEESDGVDDNKDNKDCVFKLAEIEKDEMMLEQDDNEQDDDLSDNINDILSHCKKTF